MPEQRDYQYWLAPVPQITFLGQQAYGPPQDAIAWIDLRKLNGTGYGIFWGNPDMASMVGGINLGRGDCRLLDPTNFKNAWESFAGTELRPVGDTLMDSIWWVLTDGSDPNGVFGPRPIVPSGPATAQFELWLPGHSLVKSEKCDIGHRLFDTKIAPIFQAEQDEIDLRKTATNLKERPSDEFLGEMRLDYECEKYGIDKTKKAEWEKLLPARLRPGHKGPKPHKTSYTEDFNTADSDTLGADLTWTEIAEDIDIVSNAAAMTANNTNYKHARAEHDVSSSDNKAKTKFVNFSSWDNITASGVKGRHSSSAITAYECYVYRSGSYQLRTVKWVGGGLTLIGTGPSTSGSDTTVWEIRCNGSTISRYIDDALESSTTDTGIATGTRGGITMYGDNAVKARIDDWSIEDLAASTAIKEIIGGGFILFPR